MNNTLHYTSPKLSVKDSFDDDEVSDDIEDEVFIRDGKNGFKLDDEMGVKRPLMAPRRKFKYNQLNPDRCKKPFIKRICLPYSYGVSLISVLLGLTITITIFLFLVPNGLNSFTHWKMEIKPPVIVPCNKFKPEYIWHTNFPFMKTETAIASFDVNGDDNLDVIIGFATGIEEREMPEKCGLFDGTRGDCGGGVIAIDGKTGIPIWIHWARKDILFLECSQTVNEEKTPDCLVSGKGGVMCVLDGRTGALIWEFVRPNIPRKLDLYSAQYTFDLNEDGTPEVLISHISGHIFILSGQNGDKIGQIESPDKKSIFTVPRVVHTLNQTYTVIFATGGIDSPGALYIIPLDSLALSDISKCRKIWEGQLGISSGILLADLNIDDWADFILTSGHTVSVISGKDYSMMWNITSKDAPSQILMGPTPAYFDDDVSPDLLVSEMIGPAFPTYYYSKTWAVSGQSGKYLLDDPILGTGEITSPGISISFTGVGNDMFLYWSSTCSVPFEQMKQPFSFSHDTTLHEKLHADFCKLRFNTTIETQLYLLSQHIEPPGILIYSSKNQWDMEHNNTDGSLFYPSLAKGQKFRSEKMAAPSSFRHKVQQPLLQFPSEPGQKKSSYGNYAAYEDGNNERGQWEQPHISFSDRFSMIPNVNFGDLGDPYYLQDANNNDIGGASIDDGRDERANYGKEMKRYAPSPPMVLPRARSTATLVNSVNGSGVDIIFATYWETPASNIRIFNKKEQECIQRKLVAERQNSNSLNSLELEMVEESAERECTGTTSDWTEKGINNRDSPNGQMTVFRVRLVHGCTEIRSGEECSTLLPIDQQSYPRRGSDIYHLSRPLPFQQFLTA